MAKGTIQQQNNTIFEPNRRMQTWVATAERLGPMASISSISRKTGIPRDAWYKWVNKPGFFDWYELRWKKILMIYRWKLDAIGLKRAETSYVYWRDMQRRVGNMI